MQYVYRCPYCGVERWVQDHALWTGEPAAGEPSEPQKCCECPGWVRIVLVAKDKEMTVEKCAAPDPDPVDILGTGL